MRIVARLRPAALALLCGACQVVLGIESRAVGDLGAEDAAPSPSDGAVASRDADAGCSSEQTECGGSCFDLTTEAAHCGSCEHSCGAVGACRFGECVPELVRAARSTAEVYAYRNEVMVRTIDPLPTNSLTQFGTLRAIDVDTRAERSVGIAGRYFDMIVVGDLGVAIEEYPSPRIRTIDLRSGSDFVVYAQPSAAPAFRRIVMDGDELFWTTRADVRTVHRDGSGYKVLKTVTEGTQGAGPALVLDATRVFFPIEDQAMVWSIPRSGGAGEHADTGRADATDMMPWSSTQYLWWNKRELRLVPFDDGSVVTVPLLAGTNAPHGTLRVGDTLYWVDGYGGAAANEARVVRLDFATKKQTVLLSRQKDIGNLAIVGDYIYFAYFDGGLHRIAR